MRIPLSAGREFAWTDSPSAPLRIILNQSAVRQLFPDGNALGRSARETVGDKTKLYEVVGVVGDAKYEDLRSPAPPTACFAMSQDDGEQSPSFTGVVRTSLGSGALGNRLAPSPPS